MSELHYKVSTATATKKAKLGNKGLMETAREIASPGGRTSLLAYFHPCSVASKDTAYLLPHIPLPPPFLVRLSLISPSFPLSSFSPDCVKRPGVLSNDGEVSIPACFEVI